MKRIVALALLLGICLAALPSCAAVMVNAPPNSNVKLLAELDPAPSMVMMKNWYVLWGLVPITNNNTADIIAKHGLKEVKVRTYYSFVDFLIDAVLGFASIHTNTVIIEGNLK